MIHHGSNVWGAMDSSHPFGMTEYERLDEAGEPFVRHWDLDGIDCLDVGERVSNDSTYFVIGSFAITDHGPHFMGLQLAPYSLPTLPPPMLTAAILRSVSVDRLYELARNTVSISSGLGIYLDVKIDEFRKHPRPGRVGRPDVFYASLAAQYVELLKASATPTKALAELHSYSESSMRDYLHQARERGLLTKAPPGRSGGELTDKAKEILNAN
jgi:hypothetical protein